MDSLPVDTHVVNKLTQNERRAYFQLHGCVILWGFTAILGRIITLPAGELVAWRMACVTVLLATFHQTWKGLRVMRSRSIIIYLGIGCIVAAHWLAFYSSIKMANASVAVACLGLSSVFAAILEPFITRRPHERYEILLGALAIPGVVLIVGGVPIDFRLGIVIGVASAFLSSIFTTLNKRFAEADNAFTVTAIEMTAGAVLLGFPILVGNGFTTPTGEDLLWIIVLAAVCTLLPFVLWLHSLRNVSAFSTLLILNLEPVYAILLAAFLFHEYEDLTLLFYLGTAIVLLTVILQPRLRQLTPSS